jgi:hypothetical protein
LADVRLLDYSTCSSPIENFFYYDLQKHLADDVSISEQFECQTFVGTFYLDFLTQVSGREVRFECDAKNLHCKFLLERLRRKADAADT